MVRAGACSRDGEGGSRREATRNVAATPTREGSEVDVSASPRQAAMCSSLRRAYTFIVHRPSFIAHRSSSDRGKGCSEPGRPERRVADERSHLGRTVAQSAIMQKEFVKISRGDTESTETERSRRLRGSRG